MTGRDAHADLMLQLLVERFGQPTPEWHPPAAVESARALRLVRARTRKAG